MLIGQVVVSIVAAAEGADSFTGGPVYPSSPRGGEVFDFTTARVGCELGAVNTTGQIDTEEVMGTIWFLDSGARLARTTASTGFFAGRASGVNVEVDACVVEDPCI